MSADPKNVSLNISENANAKPANAKPANAKPANAKPANANAKPSPQIVTVVKAANAAVNANANKVAELLESEVVVKAAQNLLDKLNAHSTVEEPPEPSAPSQAGGRRTRKSKGKSRSTRR